MINIPYKAIQDKYNRLAKWVRSYTRIESLQDYMNLDKYVIEKIKAEAYYDPETHSVHTSVIVVKEDFIQEQRRLHLAGDPDIMQLFKAAVNKESDILFGEFVDGQISKDEAFAQLEALTKLLSKDFALLRTHRDIMLDPICGLENLVDMNKRLPYNLAHEFSHAKIEGMINDLSMFGLSERCKIAISNEARARIQELLLLRHKFKRGRKISLPKKETCGSYLHDYLYHLENTDHVLDRHEVNIIIGMALDNLQNNLSESYIRQFGGRMIFQNKSDTKAGQEAFYMLMGEIFRMKIDGQELHGYESMSDENKLKFECLTADVKKGIMVYLEKVIADMDAMVMNAHGLHNGR